MPSNATRRFGPASAADLQSRPCCRSGSWSSPAPWCSPPCSAARVSRRPRTASPCRSRSLRRSSRLRGLETRSYTLTCDPAGGTLPLADQICAVIAAHPSAMLAPAQGRATCSPPAGVPSLTVTATADGVTRSFGGVPMCSWPVGTTLQVYAAATGGDAEALAKAAAVLHCGEDPALLALPTPWTDVNRCLDAGFVAPPRRPSAREIVRLAERAPELRPLHPSRLFPEQVGTAALRDLSRRPPPQDAQRLVRLLGSQRAHDDRALRRAVATPDREAGDARVVHHARRASLVGRPRVDGPRRVADGPGAAAALALTTAPPSRVPDLRSWRAFRSRRRTSSTSAARSRARSPDGRTRPRGRTSLTPRARIFATRSSPRARRSRSGRGRRPTTAARCSTASPR